MRMDPEVKVFDQWMDDEEVVSDLDDAIRVVMKIRGGIQIEVPPSYSIFLNTENTDPAEVRSILKKALESSPDGSICIREKD